jgi:predicted nucleic acid-binding protein
MPFLLDTNVISETVRPRPEPLVLAWLERQSPVELFLASQTIGELVRGACKVGEKARRDRFTQWIEEDLARQFEGRILAFDEAAARIWGSLMGEGDRTGQTPPAADTQIAAVAIARDLTLVTRNVKDFERFDVAVLNPWEVGDEG